MNVFSGGLYRRGDAVSGAGGSSQRVKIHGVPCDEELAVSGDRNLLYAAVGTCRGTL